MVRRSKWGVGIPNFFVEVPRLAWRRWCTFSMLNLILSFLDVSNLKSLYRSKVWVLSKQLSSTLLSLTSFLEVTLGVRMVWKLFWDGDIEDLWAENYFVLWVRLIEQNIWFKIVVLLSFTELIRECFSKLSLSFWMNRFLNIWPSSTDDSVISLFAQLSDWSTDF